MLSLCDRVAALLARGAGWSPIGEHVLIVIDDCGDAGLSCVPLSGVIRAYNVSPDGWPDDTLVELSAPITYAGHYLAPDIQWLVARPCLRWRRTTRLLFSWSAVRLIDAPSFIDATFDRTIGVGRMCAALGATAMHERLHSSHQSRSTK